MSGLDYLRFAVALLFVLGLIGMLAWFAMRFRLAGAVSRSSAERRLAVVEVVPIDPRRKLVLVRRDATEHLLLLGQDGGQLIESSIAVANPRTAPAAALEIDR